MHLLEFSRILSCFCAIKDCITFSCYWTLKNGRMGEINSSCVALEKYDNNWQLNNRKAVDLKWEWSELNCSRSIAFVCWRSDDS